MDLFLKFLDSLLFLRLLGFGGKIKIRLPPIDPHLHSLVHRSNQEPYFDGEQVNIGDLNFDVSGDDEALI